MGEVHGVGQVTGSGQAKTPCLGAIQTVGFAVPSAVQTVAWPYATPKTEAGAVLTIPAEAWQSFAHRLM
jgi:hypothetical protein